jgi:type I site-specific restriction endonuclease
MSEMVKIPLNLPSYSCKTKENELGMQIFDPIRKKYVQLTPEEWVRQHFINYLVEHCGVPAGLIGVEVALKLNAVNHRADIVIYSKQGSPIALVECKAPEVELNALVIEQIGRYNIHFKAKYLFITNGLKHYSVIVDWENKQFKPISTIPNYIEMIS